MFSTILALPLSTPSLSLRAPGPDCRRARADSRAASLSPRARPSRAAFREESPWTREVG